MDKFINSNQIQEILNLINQKKFDDAINKIEKLSIELPNNKILNKLLASTYFNKMDWHNSIKYHEKILYNEKDKYKIFTNIGYAYFKLGKINQSIDAYENSIKDNSNFELAYNNLAIACIEIGQYEKAYDVLSKILKLNKNNYFAQKNLIYLLNFINPQKKNEENNFLLEINSKIKYLTNNFNLNDLYKISNLKKIFLNSEKEIKKYYKDLTFKETQIYRKNSIDLNCKRHFQVFNKFNIIPKFCFSCYKVQINLNNVLDLIKLYFVFDYISLENNNIRKCLVELRKNVNGNYKGYIYCRELAEAKKIEEQVNNLIKQEFKNYKIEIKHGCTEFYKSFPKFNNIKMHGKQDIEYDEKWAEKENIIDNLEPLRSDLDKKVLIESVKGINLADILIIKNWLVYASIIGDESYKKIYPNELHKTFLNDILLDQLSFRKNNQKQTI